MTINFSAQQTRELRPRITVFGVGGAGGNAVTNMIESGVDDVEFVVANTDAQALSMSHAERKVQLGISITEGLGAGARPEIGCAAAEEAVDEISEHLTGAHMVFITAGMGGGTGTGAAPVIARIARDLGILTVGVVTKPFQFEGARRMSIADEGIAELQRYVDTLIVIPNQNLFRIANEKTTFSDAFAMADQVLHSGVTGITDLMLKPGIINLDFADVRTVMNEMGKAMMGTGEATGEKRAVEAAEAAISNPLLDEVSMKGAKGVLVNITGGMDLTLYEVDEAANRIRSEVDPDANIIVGSTFDESMDGTMRVSVVATGIETEAVGLHGDTVVSLARAERREAPVVKPKQAPATVEELPVERRAAAEPEMTVSETAPFEAPEDETTEPEESAAPEPKVSAQVAPDLEDEEDEDLPRFMTERPVPVANQRPSRTSPGIFERLLGGRKEPAEEERPARAPQPKSTNRAVEPAVEPHREAHAAAQQLAEPRKDEPVRAETATSERVLPETRAAQPREPKAYAQGQLIEPSFDEEQLEIPAFLRRQVN